MEEREWPNLVEGDDSLIDAIDERVGLIAAQIHSLGAELVEALAELDAVDGWVGDGYRSFAQWISVRTRFSVPESRRLARAAVASHTMPTLMGAAREGRVSVGVLADAARVVTPDNEARVADVVLACTAAQSSQVLSKFRDLSDLPELQPQDGSEPAAEDELPTEPERRPESWWRFWWDEQGRGRIDAALDPLVAATMEQAWAAARAAGEREATRDRRQGDGDPIDPTDPHDEHRLTPDEIAGRLAEAMLQHADDDRLRAPGGDRFVVQVNMDVATFADLMGLEFDSTLPVRLGSECFMADTGRHLTRAEAAEVLCRASVQVLVAADGVPLWMSEPDKPANRWQRRALAARSGVRPCCEMPGCTQTEFLHAHHVRYRRNGGPTSLDNLVLLCGHHHRLLHQRGWTVTTDGDQRFTFWDGRKCLGSTIVGERTGRPPDLSLLPLVERPPDAPPDITGDTTLSDTGGERMTPWAMSIYLEHLFAA